MTYGPNGANMNMEYIPIYGEVCAFLEFPVVGVPQPPIAAKIIRPMGRRPVGESEKEKMSMNFLKKWKRFWTLDRHHDAGFTLVELIVVIAILAILGGVAVPAYSGYVKKANMQADISLAAEVEQALILAYYGGALEEGFSGGSVVLSLEGARVDGDTALEEAMKKAFGEGWEALKLKYDGWKNTKGNIKVALQNSNFADAEGNLNMELLGAVDNLTGQLGDVMSTLDWSSFAGFTGFLTENGIDQNTDPQMAANSAVLYLSQTSMDPEKREDVANQLVQHFGQNTHYNDANEVEINLYDFMVNMTTSQTCTEFET